MSKAKKYYELYKTHKSSFKTDTNNKVIWQWDNLYNYYTRLKPVKNRSGSLWTQDGVLFADEIPLAVNLGEGRDCVYVHSIYLDKLPDVSYIRKYAKEIQEYVDRRPPQGKFYMPLSIDIIQEVAESVLK